MDIVRFPIASGGATVARALDIMKEQGVSGIVVPMDQRVNLVGYGDLVARRVPRRMLLTSVPALRVAPHIQPGYADRMKLRVVPDMKMRPGDRQRLQRFLIQSGYTYAAFGRAQDHINVASLHETSLDLFRLAPMDCYCSNPHRPHPYGPVHPLLCTIDQTPIVC